MCFPWVTHDIFRGPPLQKSIPLDKEKDLPLHLQYSHSNRVKQK